MNPLEHVHDLLVYHPTHTLPLQNMKINVVNIFQHLGKVININCVNAISMRKELVAWFTVPQPNVLQKVRQKPFFFGFELKLFIMQSQSTYL